MMREWTSYKRVEAVFNGKIPDKVPKYEGSIEIKALNPVMDGRLVWRTNPDGTHTRHGFVRAAVKTCKKIDTKPVFSIFGG
ncbi:MAG: hypothetical protein ACOC44_02740 [Promethearchaeia archaeon]